MLHLFTYKPYPSSHIKTPVTARSASNWLKRNAGEIKFAFVTFDGAHSIAVVHTTHDYKGKKMTISGHSGEVAAFVVKYLRNIDLRGWRNAPRWFLELIFTFTPNTADMLCEGFDLSFTYKDEHYIGNLEIIGDAADPYSKTAVYIDTRHTLYITLENITNIERITRK